jgi:hypothetical protein
VAVDIVVAAAAVDAADTIVAAAAVVVVNKSKYAILYLSKEYRSVQMNNILLMYSVQQEK